MPYYLFTVMTFEEIELIKLCASSVKPFWGAILSAHYKISPEKCNFPLNITKNITNKLIYDRLESVFIRLTRRFQNDKIYASSPTAPANMLFLMLA